MAKWSEMSVGKQLGIIAGTAIVVTVALYFLVFKSLTEQNAQTQEQVNAVKAENESLRPYDNKLADLEHQIDALKQQLAIQKRIVPDEKEADQFIHLVQATANTAGIEVRGYTAKPTATKEFFVEAPFEMSIDGPYYSVLGFFDKLAKVERIINISGLQMASVTSNNAPVKRKYSYAPGETVVASCVATTYFSHEPAAAPKPAAPGQK
jgi:type IV pilus assembly protein PilO